MKWALALVWLTVATISSFAPSAYSDNWNSSGRSAYARSTDLNAKSVICNALAPTSAETAATVSFQGTALVPIPKSPRGSIREGRPSFSWTEVGEAATYGLQVVSIDHSTTLFDSSVTPNCANGVCAYTPTIVLRDGNYTFQLRVEADGPPGAYGPSRTFSSTSDDTDTDGDSLPDTWEQYGYDADYDGVVDVDLPALGANRQHKDLFVQMDYMVTNESVNLAPSQEVMDDIVAVFANAPLSNPDGVSGIAIHLELANQVPFQACFAVGEDYDDWSDFDAIKATSFNSKRTATHRYMIWANGYDSTCQDSYAAGNGSSGLARGIPAVNFIVTLGAWGSACGKPSERLGTFIHELGHTIGLTHGGNAGVHTNYKPNHFSVMNYEYQVFGLRKDAADGATHDYSSASYGTIDHPHNFDYQRFSVNALDENALYESQGVTELSGYLAIANYGLWFESSWISISSDITAQVDWNKNDHIDAGAIVQDLNSNGTTEVLDATWNEWANMQFSGGGIIGSGMPPRRLQRYMPSQQLRFTELRYEDIHPTHQSHEGGQ